MYAGVFGRHAAAYRERLDSATARGEARGRALVVERLGLRAGERVLDLGCGPGVLSAPLRAAVGAGGLVVGVDLSAEMLALAASSGAVPAAAAAAGALALARMDMERLGLAGGAFDAVACGHALQFCPDLRHALAEVRRVLRPGGRFAASLPAPARPTTASRVLDEVLATRVPPAVEVPELARTRAILSDRPRTRAALAAAGLHAATIERVEERSEYAGPEELVDRTLRWWSCAWRLEALPHAAREQVREEAVWALHTRLGGGPVTVRGASWVLSAAH